MYVHNTLSQGGRRSIVVKACNDMVESFEMKRQSIIQQIVNTMDEKGFPMYFPILDKTIVFPNTTLNMLRAWHSIESVFRLMEEHEREQQQYDPHHWTNYTCVAMLRADVRIIRWNSKMSPPPQQQPHQQPTIYRMLPRMQRRLQSRRRLGPYPKTLIVGDDTDYLTMWIKK